MSEVVAGVAPAARAEENKDLGFGSKFLQVAGARFLNRDGTFNVVREGQPFLRALNPYHALLTVSWPAFFALLFVSYLLVNLVFAGAYLLCGPSALEDHATTTLGSFGRAFFFSVQTLATIGYGGITPRGLEANLVVSVESLAGILVFALVSGLSFARFSRPVAHILYSERAVIAPYRGITGFMFRIINERRSQLFELEAKVIFSRMVDAGGARVRRFDPLPLERDRVLFFPLHWTVVHPIDASSPMYGMTEEALRAADAEFLILLTAIDETFSQSVHSRSSYKPDELVVGARFSDMFVAPERGRPGVDVRRLHDLERAPLGP